MDQQSISKILRFHSNNGTYFKETIVQLYIMVDRYTQQYMENLQNYKIQLYFFFFFFCYNRPFRPIAAIKFRLHSSLSFAPSSAFLTLINLKFSCILPDRLCLGSLLGLLEFSFHFVIYSLFMFLYFKVPRILISSYQKSFNSSLFHVSLSFTLFLL